MGASYRLQLSSPVFAPSPWFSMKNEINIGIRDRHVTEKSGLPLSCEPFYGFCFVFLIYSFIYLFSEMIPV